MIELLIVLSTVCPSNYAGDRCYKKMEVSRWIHTCYDNKTTRQEDQFVVLGSTTVPMCEVEGHRYVKRLMSNLCMSDCSYWICRVCNKYREYKTIKRVAVENIPDDGPNDRVESGNTLPFDIR